MNKLVYNASEASKVLNIGMNKMYELVNNNQIPFIRVGRKILIPKKELNKWLKNASDNLQYKKYGGLK
jgi:excisionase family DNA binding protein